MPAKRFKNLHQAPGQRLLLLAGAALSLFLVCPVGIGIAPGSFGRCRIFLQLGLVKCGKIHGGSSCFLHSTGEGDQILQMLLFQGQQPDLLCQRSVPVKIRPMQNRPDFPQGKFQLPKQ